jgi:catechol 2,3-dioxygenase-like lactoylglutathione lyase family enzyme
MCCASLLETVTEADRNKENRDFVFTGYAPWSHTVLDRKDSMTEQAQMQQRTSVASVPMKLEVVVIPVSDIERAKVFYQSLGWRLDARSSLRLQALSDLQAVVDQLAAAGIKMNEVYHVDASGKHSSLHPERQSYRSFEVFQDPDGNRRALQEVTTRLSGRIDPSTTSFSSANDLECPATHSNSPWRTRKAYRQARRRLAQMVRRVYGGRAVQRETSGMI